MNAALNLKGGAWRPPETAKPQNRTTQLLAATALSLGVTLGLFVLMERLVRVDEFVLNEAPVNGGIRDFLMKKPLPPTIDDRPLVERPIIHDLPAMRPPEAVSISDTGLPAPQIADVRPQVPADISVSLPTTAPYTGPTRPMAVRRPLPVYPRRAAEMGISGTCDVAFSLNPGGEPYNVAATCTNAAFVSAAESAVRKARFVPAKNTDGTPREAHNMVWPLEFQIQ